MSIMIPKKVADRIAVSSKKYIKVLEGAVKNDISESDTVLIIRDMLDEIFGYDRFNEITTEFAIRNIYCDVAIKIDGIPRYIIEVKSVGTKLNENHIRQAAEYCTKTNLDYAILTNGPLWKVYNILYKRPIKIKLLFEIDWLKENLKDQGFYERVFCLCKEGIAKTALSQYQEEKQATNKYILGAIILGDQVLKEIRKEVKRFSNFSISIDELRPIIREEVLKREIIEGDEVSGAIKKYKSLHTKEEKQKSDIPKEKLTQSDNASP